MNIFTRAALRFAKKDFERHVMKSASTYASLYLSGEGLPYPDGTYITAERAMKYSAVFACVRVLSETLASLPIILYRRLKNGDKERATDEPLYDILHNAPNDEMAPINYKESMMVSLCLGGDGYSQKIKNYMGEVIGLIPLDYNNVKCKREENGQLVYKVKVKNEWKTYTRADIFHIPGLSLNGLNGLTPISYAAEAVKLGLNYEKFGNRFFENGANPGGVIEHPGILGDDAATRIRKDFAERYSGLVNTGKPILLEEGMKYTALTVKQADAQYLESRKFQTEDIARIFRVPLHLIQNLDRATNNNIEHQSLEFVIYTMLPWFRRWEENINLQLLTPAQRKSGLYVEFLIDALLRGDILSRYRAYAIARNWGWMSANDVLRKENGNSIGTQGDIYLQPTNMQGAGDNGEDVEDDIKSMLDEMKTMLER